MRKYYIFAGLFLLLSYSLAAYSFFDQRLKAKDEKTATKVQEIHSSVKDYYNSEGILPIESKDLKNFPSGDYEYVKIREGSFMVCANFETAKKGYTYYLDSLDSSQKMTLQDEVDSLKAQKVNFNGQKRDAIYVGVSSGYDVTQAGWQKGINCFVTLNDLDLFGGGYDAPQDDPQFNKVKDECDNDPISVGHISAYVTTVDANAKKINLDTEGQFIVKNDGSIDEVTKKYTSISFDDKTLICSYNYDAVNINELSKDDLIYIYTKDYLRADRINLES